MKNNHKKKQRTARQEIDAGYATYVKQTINPIPQPEWEDWIYLLLKKEAI